MRATEHETPTGSPANMTHDNNIAYHFSGYRLDARHRKLFDPHGEPVALSARPFDALLFLVERPGQILSREELMEAVWPQLFVEENNLTQAISTIRKALHEAASESQFIRTVPGSGYCFMAPVEKQPGGGCAHVQVVATAWSRASRWSRLWLMEAVALGLAVTLIAGLAAWDADAVPAARRSLAPLGFSEIPKPENRIPNSIAVLPLVTLSRERDVLFTHGLHDEIISQLTKNRSLKIVARSSVVALLEDGSMLDMARVLRVESILSGTIRLAGSRARISLQLLDVNSGLTRWSDMYDVDQQDLAEMISIQGDIALNVAAALEREMPNLTSEPRMRNVRADATAAF